MNMKTFKIIAGLLILAVSFSACKKNEDIDMSKIDFSNIENLYEQPLPVIKKAVEGKWKVHCICVNGYFYELIYPENVFLEFKEDHYIFSDEVDGSKSVTYFTWKKQKIEDWSSLLSGYETYMICDNNNEESIYSKLYFDTIHNDTLSFGTYRAPIYYSIFKVK